MPGKRRLKGPGGAVFVPNVDADTIRLKIKSGEWSEVPKPEPKPEPKAGFSSSKAPKQ